MNIYKESYYNIKSFNNGKFIILNTLNGNFIQFDSDIASLVRQQLDDLQWIRNENLFDFLISKGFVKKWDDCEKNKVEKLKDSIINNNEQLNLIIFPTEKCNFRCKYCYESFEKKAMSDEVQKSLVDFVGSNIKKYRKVNVNWFGGEPLLNMDVIENVTNRLLELCAGNRVLYTAEITTNGFFLTPENIEILKRCRVYKIQVTLDGLEETHDSQRLLHCGDKSWQVIINNLRYIRDNIKSGLIQVTIRTNLTKEIYSSYIEYIEFLKKEFIGDKRFSYLFRLAADWGNMQQDSIKEVFCGEEQYLDVLTYSLKNNLVSVGLKMCLVPGGLLCYAWKNNTIVIRSDGIVGKCTLNLSEEMNQISYIDNYNLGLNTGFWDAKSKGSPDKCLHCKKYPVCLKINCNLSAKTEVDCEYDMKYLEDLLSYLCKPEYGCRYIYGKDVL